MTEFTAEFIEEQRKIIRNGTMTALQMKGNNEIDLHINMMYRRAKQEHCEKYYPEALDHIERLQAKTKRLKHYLEEAAHAAACGKNPADYLAREVPTELRDEIERLQARVQELEQERRWIPVSERLPEKNGFYYLHIHSDDGRSYERVGIFFIDGYFDVLCDKVTHWQHLPQPTKEGE